MFLESPNGVVINTDHIVRMTPLTSGYVRVVSLAGEIDIDEEYADIIREAVKPKKRKTNTNT